MDNLKYPSLDIAHYKFLAQHGPAELVPDAREKLLKAVAEADMSPYYESVYEELGLSIDHNLLSTMKHNNEKKLNELKTKLEDAEKNLGETDVLEALQAIASYHCQIGHKDETITAYRLVYEKAVALGLRLEVLLVNIRVGMFFQDHDLVSRNIERAKSLLEEGGDWDRRNRLRVYEGITLFSRRDFKGAAKLLVESLSTFSANELMEYRTFVKYAIISAMLSLNRVDLKRQVVNSSEILQVIQEVPFMQDYLNSFYDCNYSLFFKTLANVEQEFKKDRIIFPVYRFIVKEMKILAYSQLLESYRSLTLDYMSKSFGVSVEFIDNDLSRLIALGRINAVIDKVRGVVETNRPDLKNAQYQALIKQGDILLNRLQKLGRVINV